MYQGILTAINPQEQSGKIEQAVNRRQYDFALELWEGKESELEIGIEIEFDAENGKVFKIRPKPKPIDPDEIPVTKESKECINEFFAYEMQVLEKYKDFTQGHKRLDFLRAQRFILTAYNHLNEIDNALADARLKGLKDEILSLYGDYESYNKKTSYSLEYSFEKIFLNRQSGYLKAAELIEMTQSSLANAQAQSRTVSRELEEKESSLKLLGDKSNSENYLLLEREVKSLRKRDVDLLQYIAKQKELLVKTTERMKIFRETHLQDFSLVYGVMNKNITEHFITLLDTKAYDLDSCLWERAKKSENVKLFFRDAGIIGGYSSKTFLQYFLRGLDKKKISEKSKELFKLLHYLESVSQKKILLIGKSESDINRDMQVILKVDSCVSVTAQQKMIPAFNELCTKNYDIVIMDWENEGVNAVDFIRKFRQSKSDCSVVFILIIPESGNSDFMIKARSLGVELFVPFHNADLLSDAVRMAI